MFESMQRGIERSLVNLTHVFRNLLDALRDGPAMHGSKSKSSQNQQIERAMKDIET
jgi:hypothetical protein